MLNEVRLVTRPLMTLEITVGEPLELGDSGAGGRRCIPLLGGRFFGELSGRVVPGGSDWQTVLPAGTLEIAAHYALETDDGCLIEVASHGVRHTLSHAPRPTGDPNPPVNPVYFRTHIRLRTSAPRYARLNSLLAVSTGVRLEELVRLSVFEVL